MIPEHLADSPEFNSNVLVRKMDIGKNEEEVAEEED